jgi:hypothetical protein
MAVISADFPLHFVQIFLVLKTLRFYLQLIQEPAPSPPLLILSIWIFPPISKLSKCSFSLRFSHQSFLCRSVLIFMYVLHSFPVTFCVILSPYTWWRAKIMDSTLRSFANPLISVLFWGLCRTRGAWVLVGQGRTATRRILKFVCVLWIDEAVFWIPVVRLGNNYVNN